jgi:hypothetical protein
MDPRGSVLPQIRRLKQRRAIRRSTCSWCDDDDCTGCEIDYPSSEEDDAVALLAFPGCPKQRRAIRRSTCSWCDDDDCTGCEIDYPSSEEDDAVALHKVLRLRGGGGMEIHVKLLSGETIGLAVEPTSTGLTLKGMIQDKTGIPPNAQQLGFAGKEVEDARMLSDYHISSGDIIRQVMVPHGCLSGCGCGSGPTVDVAQSFMVRFRTPCSVCGEQLCDCCKECGSLSVKCICCQTCGERECICCKTCRNRDVDCICPCSKCGGDKCEWCHGCATCRTWQYDCYGACWRTEPVAPAPAAPAPAAPALAAPEPVAPEEEYCKDCGLREGECGCCPLCGGILGGCDCALECKECSMKCCVCPSCLECNTRLCTYCGDCPYCTECCGDEGDNEGDEDYVVCSECHAAGFDDCICCGRCGKQECGCGW